MTRRSDVTRQRVTPLARAYDALKKLSKCLQPLGELGFEFAP
jgi:hypothetical protein